MRLLRANLMDDELFDTSEGWDMSTRREEAVMAMRPKPGPAAYAEDYADEDHAAESAFEGGSNVKLPSARSVLTSAEIDALLRPDLSDLTLDADAPKSISDHQMDELTAPAQTKPLLTLEAARRLCARLSLGLRRDCGLNAVARVRAMEETDFSDGLGLADPGQAFICFSDSDDIAAMLALSPALADALVEAACGGTPQAGKPLNRRLTTLDTAVLSGLLNPLAEAVSSTVSLTQIETEHAYAGALCPPGRAMILDLEIIIEQLTLPARLVLSGTLLKADEPAGDPQRLVSDETANRVVTALFSVRLAHLSVPLSRLTDLKAGSTLLLGLPPDQPAELLSGGRDGTSIATGDLGRKGNKMALRLSSKIKDPR